MTIYSGKSKKLERHYLYPHSVYTARFTCFLKFLFLYLNLHQFKKIELNENLLKFFTLNLLIFFYYVNLLNWKNDIQKLLIWKDKKSILKFIV